MKQILLMVVLIGALAGCATAKQSTLASPTDATKNLSASQAADQLTIRLTSTIPEAYNRAFAGTATMSTGLEISLAGPDAPAVRAAVPPTIDGVPVNVRIVTHSYADLQPTIDRIGIDRPSWVAQGIVPSGWGPDYASNKVVVFLEKYTSAAAAAIESKYGKGLVAVSTVSRTNSASAFTPSVSLAWGCDTCGRWGWSK